ncbi:MAG: hypothetical protein EA416_14310 [Trueperaceae bacterium]|nr:MAG: hypothetical protein EA416_14310 [Trueperaceae bacterium]
MSHHHPNHRRATRPVAIALAAALVLLVAACNGTGPGGGGGSGTGTLDVAVTGLPTGTAADVAVTGPAGFVAALAGSTTLTGRTVGTYAVAARPVDALVPIGATYDPVVPSQSATVVVDATTDVTVEYDLHECIAYEPSMGVGDDLSGTWSAVGGAGDVTRTITVPSDPGGGYVTVRLKADEGIRPLLGVQVVPLVSGSIFTEATDPTVNPDPTLLEMVFEVAPGRTYQLVMRAAAASSAVTFPQGYTASWSLTSRVDCYEPNDTLETAKAIPMQNPISASFIAGYRDSNSIPALSVPTLDFYRFELHEPSAVRITLSDVADTVRPRLTLYTDAGATLGIGALAPTAGASAVYESAGSLAAGWYRVRVDTQQSPAAFSREAHVSRSNEEVPPHFLQDYTLVVETLD